MFLSNCDLSCTHGQRSPRPALTTPAVDFDTFSKILNRPGGFREPFDIEEYIRGFQVFDKDRSGFVGKGQIKYILTNLGEKMTEEEVDELFKSTIDASNDEVDYRGKCPPQSAQIHRER